MFERSAVILSVLLLFPSLLLYIPGIHVVGQMLLLLSLFLCFLRKGSVSLLALLCCFFGGVALLIVSVRQNDIAKFLDVAFFYFAALFLTALGSCHRNRIAVYKFFVFLSMVAVVNFLFMLVFGSAGTLSSPNGREYEYLIGFSTGNIWTNAFPIFRQSGIFEEPGIFGTLLSLVVCWAVRNDKSPTWLVLAGFTTGSLAFLVSMMVVLVMYLAQHYRKFRVVRLSVLVVVGLAALVFSPVADYTLSRLIELVLGNSYGDSRSHVALYSWSIIRDYQDVFFGVADSSLLESGKFSVAHIVSFVASYGLFFFVFGIMGIFLFVSKPKDISIAGVLLSILLLIQRPNFFQPLYGLLLTMACFVVPKENSH